MVSRLCGFIKLPLNKVRSVSLFLLQVVQCHALSKSVMNVCLLEEKDKVQPFLLSHTLSQWLVVEGLKFPFSAHTGLALGLKEMG